MDAGLSQTFGRIGRAFRCSSALQTQMFTSPYQIDIHLQEPGHRKEWTTYHGSAPNAGSFGQGRFWLRRSAQGESTNGGPAMSQPQANKKVVAARLWQPLAYSERLGLLPNFWHLSKWNQRLKPAVCPGSLILSHTHMAMAQNPVPPVIIPIPTKIGSKNGW